MTAVGICRGCNEEIEEWASYAGRPTGEIYHYPDCTDLGKWAIEPDPVNSPGHYRWLPVEAIEITELFNFNLGNALKYIIRADHKGKPIEDLKKARWYLDREIQRRSVESD